MKLSVPKCCEREMKLRVETSTFYELYCDNCKDVVYVKKEKTGRPTMLDD